MTTKTILSIHLIGLYIISCLLLSIPVIAQELVPGKVTDICFSNEALPPTLFSMFNETPATPCLSVRLPEDYDTTKTYPLLVYVPGLHGGPKGNIENAQTIGGTKGWIVASLPLFKKSIDRNELSGGILVSMEDYPVISEAYEIMLGRLFERIPNIDKEKSGMVGFSNGALTIAVLVSNHDQFILTHFKNFCLVDHGMFHLTDLHKQYSKDCRYLILVGDKPDMGRDLKLRGTQLQQDEWKLLGVDFTSIIMKDTGHQFPEPCMKLVGQWLRHEPLNPIEKDKQ